MSEQLSFDPDEPRRPPKSDYGVGSRGGPNPAMTVDDATRLFDKWKVDETLMMRQTILRVALQHGVVHADDLRGLPITASNNIGTSFNALASGGFIRSGKHRASVWPSTHGRKSYEYHLTEKGARLAQLVT